MFDHGVATGTILTSTPSERFTFALETQATDGPFFEHWIVLGRSEIALTDLSDGRTRITHTTSYQPRVYPRWYFEPVERWLGSALQAHMLQAYADVVVFTPLIARR